MSNSKYHNTVLFGDALQVLPTLPDGIVQTCVTSPPYWGLRDYGTGTWQGGDPECDHVKSELRKGINIAESAVSVRGGGKKIADVPQIQYSGACEKCGAVRKDDQIGLEPTPEEYVEKLVRVFREVRRLLKDDGTLWLNIGDCYNAGRNGGHAGGKNSGFQQVDERYQNRSGANVEGLKPKDLVGIPWMVAFALRADGWYLRSEIIWHKPNCMPESVKDRPTCAHEKIFLLSKSKSYYYDWESIAEPVVRTTLQDSRFKEKRFSEKRPDRNYPGQAQNGSGLLKGYGKKRNKRNVWTVSLKPYTEAHFAVFPPDLIAPCIKAGSRPGDLVLDPFIGSGTTGEVSQRLGRYYLGIDLNEKYKPMQHKRLAQQVFDFEYK